MDKDDIMEELHKRINELKKLIEESPNKQLALEYEHRLQEVQRMMNILVLTE